MLSRKERGSRKGFEPFKESTKSLQLSTITILPLLFNILLNYLRKTKYFFSKSSSKKGRTLLCHASEILERRL